MGPADALQRNDSHRIGQGIAGAGARRPFSNHRIGAPCGTTLSMPVCTESRYWSAGWVAHHRVRARDPSKSASSPTAEPAPREVNAENYPRPRVGICISSHDPFSRRASNDHEDFCRLPVGENAICPSDTYASRPFSRRSASANTRLQGSCPTRSTSTSNTALRAPMGLGRACATATANPPATTLLTDHSHIRRVMPAHHP